MLLSRDHSKTRMRTYKKARMHHKRGTQGFIQITQHYSAWCAGGGEHSAMIWLI